MTDLIGFQIIRSFITSAIFSYKNLNFFPRTEVSRLSRDRWDKLSISIF